MGIIVGNEATLVALGKFNLPVVLSVVGLMMMAGFEMKKVRGGILISIVITTLLGMVCGLVTMPDAVIAMPPSIAPIAFKLNIFGALKISLLGSIFSFMFIDLFDSLGFLIACFKEIGLEDENGHYKGLGK